MLKMLQHGQMCLETSRHTEEANHKDPVSTRDKSRTQRKGRGQEEWDVTTNGLMTMS